MSNGVESRFAAAAPLVVHRPTQRQLDLALPMKAPSVPGKYVLTFRALSPTVIGSNVETTLPFPVVGEVPGEGGGGEGHSHEG